MSLKSLFKRFNFNILRLIDRNKRIYKIYDQKNNVKNVESDTLHSAIKDSAVAEPKIIKIETNYLEKTITDYKMLEVADEDYIKTLKENDVKINLYDNLRRELGNIDHDKISEKLDNELKKFDPETPAEPSR
jgi:hypothetical protein